jgi:hypothetical protein
MPSFARITILGPSPWPRFFAAGCGRKTSHAPSAPRMAHRVHYRAACVRPDVRHVVRDAVRGKSLPECSFLAAGARPIRIPARAAARLLRKAAAGLRALGLKLASLLRKAQASLPVPRSHRAPAGQGQKQHPRGGRRRKLACERSAKTFPKTPAARPAPDCPTFPRLRSVRAVGQSGALRAGRKHRIGRAWGRSLCWRSLGLAPASAVTGSVRAGALPSPCSAWGLRITALRPGGLRKLPLFQSASFLPFVSGRCGDLRAPLRWPTRNRSCHCCAIGLRALAPPKNQTSTKPGAIVVGRGSNVFNPPPKHHQRSSKPDQTPR